MKLGNTILTSVINGVVAGYHMSSNLARYPLIATRIHRVYYDLPDQAQAEIASITSAQMDDAAAQRVWDIFLQHTCVKCGRIGRACKCS